MGMGRYKRMAGYCSFVLCPALEIGKTDKLAWGSKGWLRMAMDMEMEMEMENRDGEWSSCVGLCKMIGNRYDGEHWTDYVEERPSSIRSDPIHLLSYLRRVGRLVGRWQGRLTLKVTLL
jgi:hypothetical protein